MAALTGESQLSGERRKKPEDSDPEDGITWNIDDDHDALLVDYEPQLTRSASLTVAEIANTSREVARRALQDAEGDVDQAVITILSEAEAAGIPAGWEDQPPARTRSCDLADFAGIPLTLARKQLNDCGGDLEMAKRKLIEGILGEGDGAPAAPVQYAAAPFSCPICFCDGEVGKGLILQRCGHTFCLPCLQMSIKTQVEDGRAASVLCPMPASDCGKEVNQQELRTVLGADAFAKLDRHALEAAAAVDPTLHHCPTPDCPFITSWAGMSDGPPRCDCPVCNKSSCLQCAAIPYHVGKTCAQYQEHKQWMTDAGTKAEAMTMEYLRKSNIRTCARCGAGVVKSSGCNKMKCRCGYRFCYECGAENAHCGHTPASHGFVDNVTGGTDFANLRGKRSAT